MLRDPTRILITGYKGFVAPYMVAACAQQYPDAQIFGMVHHASLPPQVSAQLSQQQAPAHVMELQADITSVEQLQQVMRNARPDLIFHLAAVSSVALSWQDPIKVLDINAGGFTRLVQAVRAEKLAPRIVVVGSGEQYGPVRPDQSPVVEDTLAQPVNPYAVSKVTQDMYAYQTHVQYGLDVVRARPFNHFGPGQHTDFVIANFAQQIAQMEAGLHEPTLWVGNLSAQRDFLPVTDVARAYVALAAQGQAGEAYNIGSGVARSIESIVQALLDISSINVDIRVDPQRFRPVEVASVCADITKIQRDTDWRVSGDLHDALAATLDYWRSTIQTSPAS